LGFGEGANRLFIAMAGSHQIWEMELETGIVKTYAGTGSEACVDGLLAESVFAQPSGITTDGQELYVADSEVSSIRGVGIVQPQVRQFVVAASYSALAMSMVLVQKFGYNIA
jgi:hypothetical protein